ncbi:MAG TPA: ribonuclease Z [Candidatus Xenobia bacterium]|jgi:ribonuclease BN (tRNA processing enzyme)
MTFTVLGSGTGIPTLRRGAAGYVLQVGADVLVFDCGMGTAQRMLQVGIDPVSVTHLFLSHHHPDHCADTLALLFARLLSPPRPPLRLYGPTGTEAFLHRLVGAFPGMTAPDWAISVEESMVLQVAGDGWKVVSSPVVHGRVPAMGFRIESGGRSVVYTGDTSECSEVVTLARGADVLLSECSYPDDQPSPWHLTPSQVGRLATRAGVGQVVLTHLYPPCEGVDLPAQCHGSYSGPVTVAQDLTRI